MIKSHLEAMKIIKIRLCIHFTVTRVKIHNLQILIRVMR
jgi:hypothetical protein